MKPGYTIKNSIPIKGIHWAILVYNWEYQNLVQNSPIIENSFSLINIQDYKIGIWKLKTKNICVD